MTSSEDSGDSSLGAMLDRLVEAGAEPRPASFRDLAIAAGLNPATDFIGSFLHNIDLRKEDLRDFNFSAADLTGADLRGADLTGVKFDNAILDGAIGIDRRSEGTSTSAMVHAEKSHDISDLKRHIIKRFPRHRLYDTSTSRYLTHEDLVKLTREGTDFVVQDAKTGNDVTGSVLLDIVIGQEQKGQNLLPISFLRQLISLYGDSMQFLVPGYLEQAMLSFARNQEQMRKNLQATFGIFSFGQFEEMGKQNLALFERALRMLAPYSRDEKSPSPDTAAARGSEEDPRLKRL